MLDQATVRLQNAHFSSGPNLERSHVLYRRALDRGRRGQRWSRLTGRLGCLLDLASVEANCSVNARSEARLRTIPISQIRGSEGRSRYFDRDFNPLYDRTRGRWLSIAVARQQGKALPPVALIQVGDIYFVQDGHHRISVAQALGQKAIEARVIVWQVDGPLPWETTTRAPSHRLTGQRLGIERTFKKLRREGARLQERVLLSVHGLRGAVGMAPRSPVAP